MERSFGNRRITLYASGTAALSQAIANCAARSSARAPEVIIPAYGCPDLVAACIHASVYPRLVDVASSHWAYDPESLESSLSSDTVAIVAVNLLGVGDGSGELIPLCKERRIPLIQDSAQYLPREPIEWPGAYVVLSFGRGKPMNLLHGGALIESSGDSHKLPVRAADYTWKDRLLASRAAAVAFNVLTRPYLYRISSSLPGARVSEVKYEPLHKADLLPERAWRQVGVAFEQYRRRQSYRHAIWRSVIDEWSRLGVTTLPGASALPQPEPLRLALLAPTQVARDALVQNLSRSGLGASRFYGTDLVHVPGIPDMIRHQGPFPQARALAHRLFTLPTHDLVTVETVKAADDVVCAWHRSTTTEGTP